MLVIGLTGGIGSGKTTVANLFADFDIIVIDADVITREILTHNAEVGRDIINEFGEGVTKNNSELDRAALRKLIFKDSNKKKWLENLLHPLILKKIALEIENVFSPYCIVVIPLLVETEPFKLIDRILVVDTSEENQISRTIERDHLNEAEVKSILNAQASRSERLNKADDIIINDGDFSDLKKQVADLHKKYLELSTR